MKHLKLIIVLLLGISTAQAQSSIGLSASKEIQLIDGKWESWPTEWTSYEDEGKVNPEIEIILLNEDENNTFYNIKYSIGGFVLADLILLYDGPLSAKKRKEWKDENVNCYVADTGNYIYLQGVSLKMLEEDPTLWATNENSKLYMWLKDKKKAILVK